MPLRGDPRSLFRRAYYLARLIRGLGMSTSILSRVAREENAAMLAACGDDIARAAVKCLLTREIVSRRESAVLYWLMMRERPSAEGYRQAHGPPERGSFPMPYE